MSTISFTIPGQPRGKGRPRFARRGVHVATYTDADTAAYENLVALAYKAAGGGYNPDGCVTVDIRAYYKIPKSASKAKRADMLAGRIRPQTKPDADNVIKAVLDGLNGAAYADDKQVTTVTLCKEYGVEPRLFVVIAT